MQPLTLHAIKLPTKTNAGESYAQALEQFEDFVMRAVGGFTRSGTLDEGAWRDPKTGDIYREWVQSYEIACEPARFAAITDEAMRLFPDQLAIFTAILGVAVIRER